MSGLAPKVETVLPMQPVNSMRLVSKARADWIDDILPGLRNAQKYINPKYFYDNRGSKLFELITHTHEYYPCRAETEIYTRYAEEIADLVGPDCMLIEPGAGNCKKAGIMLPALLPALYVPMDISEVQLEESVQRLQGDLPWLHCMPVTGDFDNLATLPITLSSLRRVVFFPGSTIGNFEPEAAIAFMRGVRSMVDVEGGLLIGVDLEKDSRTLEHAYNDAAGVTELFNLNMLQNVNNLTGSNFQLGNFHHVARYNETQKRIEMYLRSTCKQAVTMGDSVIRFDKDECLHTENSYKYSTVAFSALATEAGFVRARTWHDSQGLFALHYFVPA